MFPNFFFYNKKAKHYIHIDGFPLPPTFRSKEEVLRYLGKPSKTEINKELIYFLSIPDSYQDRNFVKCSPQNDGSYIVSEIILGNY